MPEPMKTITCECCRLGQRVRDRFGAPPTVCGACVPHQGKLPEKVIARAESHEAMLRERLDACRASEARAQDELRQAREATAAALQSRGRLALRIVRAAEVDSRHRCPAQQIGFDPDVQRLARLHRTREQQEEEIW